MTATAATRTAATIVEVAGVATSLGAVWDRAQREATATRNRALYEGVRSQAIAAAAGRELEDWELELAEAGRVGSYRLRELAA